MRYLSAKQLTVHFLTDPKGAEKDDSGGGIPRRGRLSHFDDRERCRIGRAELVGEELDERSRGISVGHAQLFVHRVKVNVDGTRPAVHAERLIGQNGDAAGKRRTVEREFLLFLAVFGKVTSRQAASDDVIPPGRRDADGGGETVRAVAVDGEPTAGVEQQGAIGFDRGQADSLDGRVFRSLQTSVVEERHADGLADGQRVIKVQPDREILPVAHRRHFRAVSRLDAT